MLNSDPENSFLLYALAKEFENEGLIPEAIKQYEKLKNLDPKYSGLYYHLARLYYDTNELTKAFEILDSGIQICKEIGDQHALSELQNQFMNYKITE